jgi:hypothetical protein
LPDEDIEIELKVVDTKNGGEKENGRVEMRFPLGYDNRALLTPCSV